MNSKPKEPMEMHLNDYTFDDFLEQAGGPVIVDFWAPRCTA
jgi:thioredoxin-like negative regulator of GroEL